MQIYLPIAELPVNIFVILLLGALSGLLSGMFGIGGGFLTTPLLMFIGVPPAVAVASSANQIIATSVSGFIAHFRRKNVDIKMGLTLLVGGFIGSSLGVWVFSLLQAWGQIDLVISLSYVFLLGTIGTMMGIESSRKIFGAKRYVAAKKKENWLRSLPLPWKTHFPRSNIELSILLPLFIGVFAGILVSVMGVGGGFVMVPAMIYILGMPTSVVVGTSLFQIIFVTCNVTLLHAMNTHTVDVILALLLLTSSVIGVQFGTRLGMKLPSEHLRGLLSLLVLCVVLKLAFDLFVTPSNPYEILMIQD